MIDSAGWESVRWGKGASLWSRLLICASAQGQRQLGASVPAQWLSPRLLKCTLSSRDSGPHSGAGCVYTAETFMYDAFLARVPDKDVKPRTHLQSKNS